MKQLNFFEPRAEQVKPANGNTQLVDYGIQNDQSDYRVHVGYGCQRAVIFPTKEGLKAFYVAREMFEAKRVHNEGYETARGYAVPMSAIANLQEVMIPQEIYRANPMARTDLTTTKGLRAVSIAEAMLRAGLFLIPLQTSEVTQKELQIKGGDIILFCELVFQIKCDWLAGSRQYGGTGNVFLQEKECNPRKRY